MAMMMMQLFYGYTNLNQLIHQRDNVNGKHKRTDTLRQHSIFFS